MYVSTVAGEPARSRTDAHADGSTLISRKATISRFAANPTGTSFANALKAYRNHRITFTGRPFGLMRAISLNAGQISLYAGRISFNAGTHRQCGFGHKVKLGYYWNQQLTRTIRSLNEILFGHNVKFSYSFRA
jgi:hypothetical protein